MSDDETATTENVIPLRPRKETGKASEQKWGKRVIALGFSIVPSLLLRAQNRLGLNPTQLAVLLQLCDFWWERERKPYPSKALLAERLGLSPRQVQRYIAELETAGLVKRIQRRAPHGGKLTNSYDLGGLVGRLKDLEPDFRKVGEEAKKARREVSRQGFRLTQAPNEQEPA